MLCWVLTIPSAERVSREPCPGVLSQYSVLSPRRASRSPPLAAVAPNELVRGRGAPGAGGVGRELRHGTLPGLQQRRHEGPGLLDLRGAHEQRAVAEHRVQDQSLVGVGRLDEEA